jgi:hypothetical protein
LVRRLLLPPRSGGSGTDEGSPSPSPSTAAGGGDWVGVGAEERSSAREKRRGVVPACVMTLTAAPAKAEKKMVTRTRKTKKKHWEESIIFCLFNYIEILVLKNVVSTLRKFFSTNLIGEKTE